ncbi:MAG: glycerol kinase GlpK [Tissierellia bacterium]|nr:glycerol kinase GlpK [Tissierellia bacterium]
MTKYIMSFDAGTTSCRAVIYDKTFKVVAMTQREFPQYYPKPGWVEHNGMEIWGTMIGVSQEALAQSDIKPEDIHAIGITNQRETTLLWNRDTGKPVAPAIVWQCRRSSEICETWKNMGLEETVKSKTGLTLDAYFSASKIKWILDNIPEAKALVEKDKLCFGTIDTWLIWNLTGGKTHATDYSNASRTMLFDIHRMCWSEELLNAFDIPLSILPKVYPSDQCFGHTSSSWFNSTSIPIYGVLGDQQAALYGHQCYEPGMIKSTYGTGCFLLMNTGNHPMNSFNGLISTVAWGEEGEVYYALEGSVFIGGAAVQWLRDELRIINSSPESESIALSANPDHGLTVIPAFTGLGAPYWDMEARGAILGITRGSTWKDLVRATLESIALQVADVVNAMKEDSGITPMELRADGGAAANEFLMQFQADILQIPVIREEILEMTAFGAASMAAKASGFNEKPDATFRSADFIYEPKVHKVIADKIIDNWKKQVNRIRT